MRKRTEKTGERKLKFTSAIISTGKGLQLNVSFICDVERTEKYGPEENGPEQISAITAMNEPTANLEGGGGVIPISDDYVASLDPEGASLLVNDKGASVFLTEVP